MDSNTAAWDRAGAVAPDAPGSWPHQTTLARAVSAAGAGLHTGRRARVVVHPAPSDHGIVFRVTAAGRTTDVRPHWQTRVASRLNTALALPGGAKLRTIEHLMASLSGFGIDNALVEVHGREIPIFDGSARTWCALFGQAGTVAQVPARRFLRILKPLQVRHHAGLIRAEPADRRVLDVTYDRLPAFGMLAWRGEVTRETFVRDLSASRSPGSIDMLWRHAVGTNFALDRYPWASAVDRALKRAASGWQSRLDGGGEPNRPRADLPDALPGAIRAAMHPTGPEPVLRGARPGRVAILFGRRVLGGARYPDEPVRHAALDLLGDLTLAGAPILGRIVAHSPTHALTFAFCATLLQNPDAWEMAG